MIKLYLNESTELFSIYSDFDRSVIKEAGKYNMYLIGGTAIEVWLNYLNIKGWRKRSDNDLDFLAVNSNNSNKTWIQFNEWTERNRITDKVKIDTLVERNVPKEFLIKIKDIKVLHPIWMFKSKLIRMSGLSKSKDKERYQTDFKDLIDILKVIVHINQFENLLTYLDILKLDHKVYLEYEKVIKGFRSLK